MSRQAPISVAVGVIIRHERVLIAKRHAHQTQGDLWEFPGGKVEKGETPLTTLRRELHEEININVTAAHTFLQFAYDYVDYTVRLEVFRVLDFTGVPGHREGQVLKWVPVSTLAQFQFPLANQKIITTLLSGVSV